jgi:hypothetical protein
VFLHLDDVLTLRTPPGCLSKDSAKTLAVLQAPLKILEYMTASYWAVQISIRIMMVRNVLLPRRVWPGGSIGDTVALPFQARNGGTLAGD